MLSLLRFRFLRRDEFLLYLLSSSPLGHECTSSPSYGPSVILLCAIVTAFLRLIDPFRNALTLLPSHF